jgi:flagellar basal body P-ring formation protein FlgA
MIRPLLLATALVTACAGSALAQTAPEAAQSTLDTRVGDILKPPVLRAHVEVAGDLVRIGDVIDNAGAAAQIAIYRAPDLGTTGALPTETVLAALRAHRVIGVDSRDIKEVTVTRLARSLPAKEIERQVIETLQLRHGLGAAEDITLTFDREVAGQTLAASYNSALRIASERYEPRSGRFDISFELAGGATDAPVRLRATGTAIETVAATVLTRSLQRNETIKASDLAIERRPKAEIASDAAARDAAIGMQARNALRGGQVLRTGDLAKPDLVTRDQGVTLIYQTAGIFLTARGKALDTGAEGDVVSVSNPQSKRIVTGTVVGRGQVMVLVAPAPRIIASVAAPAATEAAPAAPQAAATAE